MYQCIKERNRLRHENAKFRNKEFFFYSVKP